MYIIKENLIFLGLIGKEIPLKLPNFSERKKIVEKIFEKKEILNNNEIDELSTISDNFTVANFALFHSRIKILENPKPNQIFEILNSITNKTFKQAKYIKMLFSSVKSIFLKKRKKVLYCKINLRFVLKTNFWNC